MTDENEDCCLSPLDSSRFIMERAKHVSINIPALQKLTSQVFPLFLSRIRLMKMFSVKDFFSDDGWRMFK